MAAHDSPVLLGEGENYNKTKPDHHGVAPFDLDPHATKNSPNKPVISDLWEQRIGASISDKKNAAKLQNWFELKWTTPDPTVPVNVEQFRMEGKPAK